MQKQIVYYVDGRGLNPVWRFIESLPAQERDKCLEYIAYLEETGENVRRPAGDYLGGKLYELRPKQNRLIYFFMLRNHVVLVHAFRKKTSEIPEREMAIARSRRDDFIRRFEDGLVYLGGLQK